MRADRDAMLNGELDGASHDVRIAAVKPARNVRGRDVRHDFFVGSERPAAVALAHVAIDVDVHAHECPPPCDALAAGEYTAPPEEGPSWGQRARPWPSSSRPRCRRRRRSSTS